MVLKLNEGEEKMLHRGEISLDLIHTSGLE